MDDLVLSQVREISLGRGGGGEVNLPGGGVG